MADSSFIYLRGLRHVEHTVFSVNNGQKFYWDPQFKRQLAYSSGQQVKRSIIEALQFPFAAITFNWEIDKNGKAGMLEPYSPCDPIFVDQLIGGYLKVQRDDYIVKRRSPLSISAMRPLHPLLGGLEGETEPISFDRSSKPDQHVVKVFSLNKSGGRVELSKEKLDSWMADNKRSLAPKYYNPGGYSRATGLFVYDIAIDLRTLFCVSTNKIEPELLPTIEKKLIEE